MSWNGRWGNCIFPVSPLSYADAASRVKPARPQPLGANFARGLNEPAVRVEISDRALARIQEEQARSADTLKASADNKARAGNETPPSAGDVARQKIERKLDPEVAADEVSKSARPQPPPIDLSPKKDMTPEASPSLKDEVKSQAKSPVDRAPDPGAEARRRDRVRDNTGVEVGRSPQQPPVTLEKPPAVLSSGLQSTRAFDAYRRVQAAA